MHTRVLAGVAAIAFSATVAADTIDLNLNDKAIQATYTTKINSSADLNVGLLDNDDRDSWVASAGLIVFGNMRGAPARTEIGLGGKAYVVSVGNQDICALGLGGQARVFPNNGPIGIGGYAFFAPNIVTSGDGKQFWEASARVEFEAIKDKANVYVGYRKVRTHLDTGNHVTVDSGAHIGLQVNF